jgi:hypothetical protein
MKLTALALTLLFLYTPALSQTRRAPARDVARAAAEVAGAEHPGETLPIRRVILYSNGVAYFERRGRVSGHAEISLAFKQSQVDDVLKSMIVLDLGRGRVGAVSYNSSAPPSARLAEIPFSIEAGTKSGAEAEGGLAGVLKQLQGARVFVSTSKGTATGSILTVEERRAQLDADKPPHVSHQLVIANEAGDISAFDLSDVRSVRVLDEGARRDLRQFADATASARRRDAKTIVVTSDGEGAREMLVSYTVAAPIWKTTYRVVLDSTGKPFFQGWAIVDNVGEEDWTQVKLSLVSGTPVSFIQPIQQPLYRYRPVIPIPEDLSLDPQVYEPATGVGMNAGGGDMRVGGGGPGGGGGGVGQANETVTVTSNEPPPPGPVTTVSDLLTGGESGVEAAAKGSELGDLFEYSVEQPVTVNRNRSALIPILQTRMEGERVSIYNEAARKDRPMSGLLLRNTSGLTLEDGSLTVIEGDAYAGEALLERLKPGEDRFISFALDLATLVNTRSKGGREPVFLVRIVNGVFQAHFYESERKTYTLTNQTDKPRVVFVEHPLREGWALAKDAPTPFEKTQHTYRFRVELAPRATAELQVAEQRALMDTYALNNLSTKDLALFVSRNYVDAAGRAELEKLVGIKSRLASADSRLSEIEREAREIGEDQGRLRENIKALNETAEARQLIARYVQKAGEQETRLEQLLAEKRKLQEERARLLAELEAAVRGLSLERKL